MVPKLPGEVRPWGRFDILDEQPGYKVKRLHVHAGGRLSLQSHAHRSEHWTVVNGIATVTIGTETRTLAVQESVDVPLGEKHRIENLGPSDLVIIEVQFGSLLSEEDITRYEDVYGRMGETGTDAGGASLAPRAAGAS